MNSLTEENYLKVMFNLSEKSGEVTVNELSRALNIKMPTVNSMIKKLAAKEYLNYQIYKPIQLSSKGRKEALSIIRKHRLTEMFLVEKMEFGWEEVHEVAEQIEHIHSPKFFAKMDELLGFPTVDPHGSPIPDEKGKIELQVYETLSQMEKGQTVKFVAVISSDNEFLKFLNSKDLQLETLIEIIDVEEFDKNMTVSYKGNTTVFSPKVTEKIQVELV